MVVRISKVIKEKSIKNGVFGCFWAFFSVYRGFLWEFEFLMKGYTLYDYPMFKKPSDVGSVFQ